MNSMSTSTSKNKRLRGIEEGIKRADDGEKAPQKRYFRGRAHLNPLSTNGFVEYPIDPTRMKWDSFYPAFASSETRSGLVENKQVDVVDVGCGFGGLLLGLAPVLPSSLILGLEIRPRVTEYVRLRILALRKQALVENAASSSGPITDYQNISVMKCNAMKYISNYFNKGQLSKIFFCFSDPHFKRSNHRRRIISSSLLAEYAYILKPNGIMYTITDVYDLHNWKVAYSNLHPAFERIPDSELDNDPCVEIMRTYTEEGKKVERFDGNKFVAVYRRLTYEEEMKKAKRLQEKTGPSFWDEPQAAYVYTKSTTAHAKKGSHLLPPPTSETTDHSL
jgi:tRNA (guanine-N7-)-methyltransferase